MLTGESDANKNWNASVQFMPCKLFDQTRSDDRPLDHPREIRRDKDLYDSMIPI